VILLSHLFYPKYWALFFGKLAGHHKSYILTTWKSTFIWVIVDWLAWRSDHIPEVSSSRSARVVTTAAAHCVPLLIWKKQAIFLFLMIGINWMKHWILRWSKFLFDRVINWVLIALCSMLLSLSVLVWNDQIASHRCEVCDLILCYMQTRNTDDSTVDCRLQCLTIQAAWLHLGARWNFNLLKWLSLSWQMFCY
jgi:hypothetical protein